VFTIFTRTKTVSLRVIICYVENNNKFQRAVASHSPSAVISGLQKKSFQIL